MVAVATSAMCEPKAEHAGDPHAASAPAAVPLGELRRGLQAAGEARVAAEHRHAEGERLEARGMGELVDEAFGEEAIFALRRAAHVTGVGRNNHAFDPHVGDRIGRSGAVERGFSELARFARAGQPGDGRAETVAGRDPHLPRGGDPALRRAARSFVQVRRATRGRGSGSRFAEASPGPAP